MRDEAHIFKVDCVVPTVLKLSKFSSSSVRGITAVSNKQIIGRGSLETALRRHDPKELLTPHINAPSCSDGVKSYGRGPEHRAFASSEINSRETPQPLNTPPTASCAGTPPNRRSRTRRDRRRRRQYKHRRYCADISAFIQASVPKSVQR